MKSETDFSAICLRIFADNAHLGFQFNTALLTGLVTDAFDEGKNLRGRGTAVVDDEVAVYFGDSGTTDGAVLEPQFLDEFSRRNHCRVLENTPGTCRNGLCLLAISEGGSQQFINSVHW